MMITKFKINILCILLLFFGVISLKPVFAKEAASDKIKAEFSVEKMPSLFFTYWQYKSIMDAKSSRGVVRAPTQAELDAIEKGDEFQPDIGPRDLSLGGILFNREDDWVIWLNGSRVTPSAVPKEVLDLRVFKDYIEIKWLDDYTKQVFPIRMRTHQRFNMDAKIFLPG